MFPTFTGASRPSRRVDLSGRINQNPFAQNQAGTTGRTDALANATKDRLLRHLERERAQAVKNIQRVWRGGAARKKLRAERRRAWDESQASAGTANAVMCGLDSTPPYESSQEALTQLSSLLFFLDLTDESDIARLRRYDTRCSKSLGNKETQSLDASWRAAYLRLERICIQAMLQSKSSSHLLRLLPVLQASAERIPDETARNAQGFYEVISRLLAQQNPELDADLLTIPLRSTSPAVFIAYEHFATSVLTQPLLQNLGSECFVSIAAKLNHNILGRALADRTRNLDSYGPSSFLKLSRDSRVWLLAHFIYIYGHAHNFENQSKYAAQGDFLVVVVSLLASLVDEIELELPWSFYGDSEEERLTKQSKTIEPFARDQITTLVNRDSISGILGFANSVNAESGARDDKTHARVLASYIFTLLRLFPRRGDEIRMWLYLGSRDGNTTNSRPAILQYFWQEVSASEVFKTISNDSRAAIQLLKPIQDGSLKRIHSDFEDEWTAILIFLELYIFVLKVMDDDEFFAGELVGNSKSLTLKQVQSFTIFLKHLGFTMYYKAPEILGRTPAADTHDMRKLFYVDKSEKNDEDEKKEAPNIAGVHGVSLDYIKGLVTGILRQIYARDSRRPFLPKDHWLMTSRFDMTNFVDVVVEEEDRRNQVQQEEDEERADEHEEILPDRMLVGGRQSQLSRLQAMQRQQRKDSKKRYLQQVAPRLEILQNMPFLIPFKTRVLIFRRFVAMDKSKRGSRNTLRDSSPFMEGGVARRPATIRREHEFEDAFDKYYDIGSDLKDPIAIKFIDKFGSAEAGIDGGGVTKEFLTSVTSQAFSSRDGIQMFSENDQHLLFPNPSAIDEQREYLLSAFQVPESNPHFRTAMQNLLKRFEFSGRIIGKCLYESILVDIGFAGFFLLKWSLTGGTGSAPRESGYRASINDLRDFDESLYQGLLKLKNYTGDVEQDFSLDFTVVDKLKMPDGTEKSITRELKPGGSRIAVTNANRLVYIAEIARHRLQVQPFQQTSAFLRGLASVIEPSWLSMFNQAELQTLVGGTATSISIPDLRKNTIYGGTYQIGDDVQEHDSIKIFWDVMESFSDEDRRKVLKFVTSTPNAPLLGFGSLMPKFSIRDAGQDEKRLPSTSTCVNLLKLPMYKSVAVCRTKLLQAVNAGAGFDLS